MRSSAFQVHFTEQLDVCDYREFVSTDLTALARFQRSLLDRGVTTITRGLWFVSTAHTDLDVAQTLGAVDESLGAW